MPCSTVLSLCRVCRALKKAGPPAPSYLIFRVVRSGSRWGGAPFDTSSWAIWAGQRDSARARSLKPGRRARLWSQGSRSRNRTLSTSLLTFLRRPGHTTPPRASQALPEEAPGKDPGKEVSSSSFCPLGCSYGTLGSCTASFPLGQHLTSAGRRFSSVLCSTQTCTLRRGAGLAACPTGVPKFVSSGHPYWSRQSPPERETEREKARALHRSHQAPHHVIPHYYHSESEEGTSLRHLDLTCLFKTLLACARTTHCSLCLAYCHIAETTPNIRPTSVLRVYIYGLTNRPKLRASSNRLTLF